MKTPVLVLLAGLLSLLTFPGCTPQIRRPALHVLSADFNMYARPALFYDQRDHYPSPSAHTQHYLWSHGPIVPPRSAVYRNPVPTEADSEFSPEDYPDDENGEGRFAPPPEQAPVPQLPEPGRSPLPPPPADEVPRFDEMAPPPRREGHLRTPPVLNAPTAEKSSRQGAQVPFQSASWQGRSSSLPRTGTLFARP